MFELRKDTTQGYVIFYEGLVYERYPDMNQEQAEYVCSTLNKAKNLRNLVIDAVQEVLGCSDTATIEAMILLDGKNLDLRYYADFVYCREK